MYPYYPQQPYSPYPPQNYWPQQHPVQPYPPYQPPPPPAPPIVTKYPTLNTLLAADVSALRYDMRLRPIDTIHKDIFHPHRYTPATTTHATHVRIQSKAFPWQIDIKVNTIVTCEMVWEGLHTALQQPIADSEWALLVGTTKHQREVIEKAMNKRLGKGNGEKVPKRIDWLGDKVLFGGLVVDEEFSAVRLYPGTAKIQATYVAVVYDL